MYKYPSYVVPLCNRSKMCILCWSPESSQQEKAPVTHSYNWLDNTPYIDGLGSFSSSFPGVSFPSPLNYFAIISLSEGQLPREPRPKQIVIYYTRDIFFFFNTCGSVYMTFHVVQRKDYGYCWQGRGSGWNSDSCGCWSGSVSWSGCWLRRVWTFIRLVSCVLLCVYIVLAENILVTFAKSSLCLELSSQTQLQPRKQPATPSLSCSERTLGPGQEMKPRGALVSGDSDWIEGFVHHCIYSGWPRAGHVMMLSECQ